MGLLGFELQNMNNLLFGQIAYHKIGYVYKPVKI